MNDRLRRRLRRSQCTQHPAATKSLSVQFSSATSEQFWAAANSIVLLPALVLLAAAASWANPHFVKESASINRSGDLVVSWKEAGLGNNQLIRYEASANANGFYACINRGGNHPQAANKEEFSGPVSETGQFRSGKNGHITESLTISPPDPTLSCPGNQRLVLACVAYDNVALDDLSTPLRADIPGSYSKTFLDLPECPL